MKYISQNSPKNSQCLEKYVDIALFIYGCGHIFTRCNHIIHTWLSSRFYWKTIDFYDVTDVDFIIIPENKSGRGVSEVICIPCHSEYTSTKCYSNPSHSCRDPLLHLPYGPSSHGSQGKLCKYHLYTK